MRAVVAYAILIVAAWHGEHVHFHRDEQQQALSEALAAHYSK